MPHAVIAVLLPLHHGKLLSQRTHCQRCMLPTKKEYAKLVTSCIDTQGLRRLDWPHTDFMMPLGGNAD